MDPRVEQYNAAGEALQRAVEGVRTATDEGLADAEQTFRDAQTEFQRCEANLHLADEAAAVPTFIPRAGTRTSNPNELGMDASEVRNYSMLRAINAVIRAKEGAADPWKGAELEHEASMAIAEKQGRDAQGFFLPMDVQRRDMTVGSATAGGNLVATDLLSTSFISLLRNRMAVRGMGATFLTGLEGFVKIPRQTGGGTFYWVDESTAVTETAQTVDQVALTPRTGGAFTDISRRLLLQSSIDVENFVTTDLATICALGIDYAALHGAGASGQPTGLALQTGIGSVVIGASGGAPVWGTVIDLETEVASDNADIGTLGYLTNAKVRGKLKKTSIAGTEAEMIWDRQAGATPLNGYGCGISNQVRSDITKSTANLSAMFFGNWADLIIGQWGTMDVLVDPYTGGTAGTVRIVVLQDVDVAIRHAESFAACLDIVTT